MKKIILVLYLQLLSLVFASPTLAVENPLNVANNKVGIHILFDNELKDASTLVNSSHGDWGYVTIVIQAGDKDLTKWQAFMDNAKRNHVIPIVRLATEGDFFNTEVWRKPTETDIIDFANFLDSLDWPIKNRYIVIFNEVNRGNEWGGKANPGEYADLLNFAVTVFKSKSNDFFVIPAGLDNAAPNEGDKYINEYNFLRQMNTGVPGIFNQIDGFSSHSYPNPGFSMPPTFDSPSGINSFKYEKALVQTMTQKDLPIFINETGWSTDTISDSIAANYYKTALSTVWNDPSIVAITPFLLQGRGGAFQKFSFMGINGTFTNQYTTLKNFPKIKGNPKSQTKVLAAETNTFHSEKESIKDFSKSDILVIISSQFFKRM